jgi:hypothetical protein
MSTEVMSTAQIQARCCFRFTLGYELCALLKTVSTVILKVLLLQFNTEVKAVKPIDSTSRDTKWTVTYGDIRYHNEDRTEEFDAVVVCNGYVLLIL